MKKTELLKPGSIPTREDLFKAIENQEEAFITNQLNNLLQQPPHKDWVKTNNGLEYLPIDKVEFMLTYIFGTWEWEIKREGILANSVYVTGTLKVWNRWLEKWQSHDGIGAVPIQLDKSQPPADIVRPSDLSRLKSQSIQMNLPAAASYAMSNAAARFGKIFGRDLNRKDTVGAYLFDTEPQQEEQPKQPQIKNAMEFSNVYETIPPQSQKINIQL